MKISTGEARGLCGNDDLEGEFAVTKVCPFDAVGLIPECLSVLDEDVGMDNADAAETGLDASDGGNDAAGVEGFAVLFECCADDWILGW